ncbi:ABC transporter ATP-binding protein [Vibrio sonorensis]|uniref:ABC transporter ATP-binding protein n=1 Tax=Vibrio sonorensis TaxID=1004316 RepID=UPI0008D8E823|nr:ABC transporter ATP-binding protein [Vibrio sonorensis]
MDKLNFLLKHSGAKQQQFWIGMAGKVIVELLPLVCWAMLFFFMLEGVFLGFITMLLLSLVVIGLQWWFGQSAKQSFLGAYDITYHLRNRLLLDVRGQPLATLMGKSLGEKMKLVTSDLKSFEEIFSHLVADFIAAWIIPVAMLVFLTVLNPVLGVVLGAVLVLSWVLLLSAEKGFSKAATHHHSVNLSNTDKLLEYLDCLPMLKTFGRSDHLAKPLNDKIEALRNSGLGLEWAGGTGVMGATFLLELSVPLVAFVGALDVAYGETAIGEWLVAVIAAVLTVRPFARLAVHSALLRFMMKSAGRLHRLATSPQQVKQGVAPKSFDIEIDNVSLSLGGEKVVNQIDLKIKQGEHVAITGSSGAGKSTLLHLIAAFHIPSEGRVRLGGKELDQVGTEEWYRHISYVTQDVQLFAGSLKDNLLIANKQASEEELNQVVYQAGLEDLVARLPDGLRSEIGENGSQLSGGERQRLSLARAFLHDTPVILLDEITSALDAETQNHVLDALRERCIGKTVVTVAHRLETIKDMDRIYHMDKGTIVEYGHHDELLESNGGYQRLWQAQVA